MMTWPDLYRRTPITGGRLLDRSVGFNTYNDDRYNKDPIAAIQNTNRFHLQVRECQRSKTGEIYERERIIMTSHATSARPVPSVSYESFAPRSASQVARLVRKKQMNDRVIEYICVGRFSNCRCACLPVSHC